MAKIARRVLTRNGVQYFDAGGTVISGNILPAQGQLGTGVAQAYGSLGDPALAPKAINNIAGGVGGMATGIASDFTAQNGYQAGLAPTETSSYGNTIDHAQGAARQGFGQFNDNAGNQQALIQALLRQASGQGPNPAQAQLNQNTGNNVSNTAALIAGGRGVSANPGAAARQIAEAGAGIQQGAVGQEATLQAQQELGAQTEAGNLQNALGNQIIAEQNANTGLLGASAGAQNAQNTGSINDYSMAQGINSQVAQNNANATNKTLGGFLGGLGGLSSLFAKGGEVLPTHFKEMAKIYHPHKMADGGMIQVPSFVTDQSGNGGEDGKKQGGGIASLLPLALAALNSGGEVPGTPKVNRNSFKNDTVPALLTPKEVILPLSVTEAEDPPEEAKKFMMKLQEKYKTEKPGEDHADFHAALKKAISNRRAPNATH